MFRFLQTNFQHMRIREVTTIHVNAYVVLQCKSPHLKAISNISESKNQQSVTVDYLINSCGLPPETALSASTKVRLNSTERPDSVLTLFKNHGLTKTQITLLISKRPDLLAYVPDKTLKPKIEFLLGLGISGPILSKLLVSDPTFLTRSLQNQIIPSFNFLKSIVRSNENILTILRRSIWILQCNLYKVMEPNITALREHGVPDCTISKLLVSQPRLLLQNIHRFKEGVEMAKEMGFNSSRPVFVEAVRVLAGLSKSSWEGKLAIFRSLGFSEDEILSVFKRQPICMLRSEKKLRRVTEFFMVKLKWKPADISLCPTLFCYSLEERIVPRCAVLKILESKGVISLKLKMTSMFTLAEKEFLDKFVMKYQETIPEVVKAYKGGIEISRFEEVL